MSIASITATIRALRAAPGVLKKDRMARRIGRIISDAIMTPNGHIA